MALATRRVTQLLSCKTPSRAPVCGSGQEARARADQARPGQTRPGQANPWQEARASLWQPWPTLLPSSGIKASRHGAALNEHKEANYLAY